MQVLCYHTANDSNGKIHSTCIHCLFLLIVNDTDI